MRKSATWLCLAVVMTLAAPALGAAVPHAMAAAPVPAPAGSAPADPDTSPAPPSEPAAPAVDCRRERCVALTFDDGPSPHTPALLETLRDRQVRATFFMLGSRARRHPDIVRRAFVDGHQIGSHTWDHPDLRRLSYRAADGQIAGAQAELGRVTGERPGVFRPPYGATGPQVLRSLRERNLPQVMWDVDPRDWEDRDSGRIVDRVLRRARKGSVVLLHDIHPTTVAAVPEMVRRLRERGFVLVTVSDIYPRMRPGHTYPPHARTWWRRGGTGS